MHLLNTYALSAGAKIGKPFIFEQFFPLFFDRYITLQAQTKYESKDYDYWQDVINLIFPVLEKNGIKICQVGGQNELPYQRIVDLRGKTELSQLAYIIKNSLLHVGSDSLGVHLASAYDVPIVGLYSVSQSAVSGPRFGTPSKQICFDAYLRTRNGKPSYASKEEPKCVNLIKPEEIADAIFKLVGLDIKTPIQTIFTGSKYNSKTIREFVPTLAHPITNPETPIEIRMDIHFDEKILEQQLNFCRGLIISDKRINKDVLRRVKGNVAALVYIVTENDDPKFIEEIRDLAFPIIILSRLPDEQIQPKKIDYYKYGKINPIEKEQPEKWDDIKKDIDNIYFRSNKIISDNGKVYNSNVCRVKNEEFANDLDYFKAIDVPEFWQELPFMTLVKMS